MAGPKSICSVWKKPWYIYLHGLDTWYLGRKIRLATTDDCHAKTRFTFLRIFHMCTGPLPVLRRWLRFTIILISLLGEFSQYFCVSGIVLLRHFRQRNMNGKNFCFHRLGVKIWTWEFVFAWISFERKDRWLFFWVSWEAFVRWP